MHGGHRLAMETKRVEWLRSALPGATTLPAVLILFSSTVAIFKGMPTNKKYSMITNKRKLGQRGFVLRGEVTAADAWILALIGKREPIGHCSDLLRRLCPPNALHALNDVAALQVSNL